MPKFVYIQISGVPSPAKIRADKTDVKKVPEENGGHPVLVLMLGDEKVGQFKNANVDGWWLQDED